MQLYTLQKELVPASSNGYPITRFARKDDIEDYESLIWTERYFGNGDCQLICPATSDFINAIPKGSYLGLDDSDEMMIVETTEIVDGKLSITGISVLSWLNNRFVRHSKSHKVQSWQIENMYPGEILWLLVSTITNFADAGLLTEANTDIKSEYLNMLIIPELGLQSIDRSGSPVNASVDFEELYNAMYKIATTYTVGMQIRLQHDINPDSIIMPGVSSNPLVFRSYSGLDRTHEQIVGVPRNDIVTFSKALDSLVNPHELHSLANAKTLAFSFGASLDSDLGKEYGDHNAGLAWVTGKGVDDPDSSGLNCRAMQILDQSLSGFPSPLGSIDIEKAMGLLNRVAKTELKKATPIEAIDGEIVSTNTYQYKRDYYLGDLVEIEGENGLISVGRVMEYIMAKDANGERKYPTLSLIDSDNITLSRDDLGPGPYNPYDNAGDAYLITGNKGQVAGTTSDCSTDGQTLTNNTDWLMNELGSPYKDLGSNDPDSNYRTTWYKWAVPSGWNGASKLKVWLSDYNAHMIIFAMVPLNKFAGSVISPPVIPDPGNAPSSAHQDKYYSFGYDVTEKGDNPPYAEILTWVDQDIWTGNTNYKRWVFIGIASPPVGQMDQTQDSGGNFRLHWRYWET